MPRDHSTWTTPCTALEIGSKGPVVDRDKGLAVTPLPRPRGRCPHCSKPSTSSTLDGARGVPMTAATRPTRRPTMKGRIFSGIQPSGKLHLGNHLGAIRNWVRLQGEYEAIYCIVDLHAITVPQEPAELRAKTYEVAAGFLAAGSIPSTTRSSCRATPAHAQLAWIFNCVTPLGWLNRMTQFKDKGQEPGRRARGSLCLSGAQGRHPGVPRHPRAGRRGPEAASRAVARHRRRVQSRIRHRVLPLPEPLILGEAARDEPARRPRQDEQPDPSDQSRINLTDDADAIAHKIRRAKSDSEMGRPTTRRTGRGPRIAQHLRRAGRPAGRRSRPLRRQLVLGVQE